jgi:hypothetical protein
LGAALLMISITETRIAANHTSAMAAIYAADAGIELAVRALAAAVDWDAVLAGDATSGFVDGPSGGVRVMAAGRAIDLSSETNRLRCGAAAPCGEDDLNAVVAERPWGINNPRWQLYAYGPLDGLLGGNTIESGAYVAVWVADDPFDNDGEPLRDGSDDDNPGRGIVLIRAHGYAAGGAVREVEAAVQRVDEAGSTPRMLSWRELP